MIFIEWTLYSSDLLELMLRHFIQTHQTYGMESVFLLTHSFRMQMMVQDTNLSVLISTLEEYVCRDDPTPGQGLCLCGAALQFLKWCCIVYQNRADKKWSAQGIGRSNPSHVDFMSWMRNCQGFL